MIRNFNVTENYLNKFLNKAKKTTDIYLNELSNIENFEFNTERLDRVRDLFVFSCYTSISYVDIINFTEEIIEKYKGYPMT